MIKEYKIGERFEWAGLVYEVRRGGSCMGCAFYIESENECTANRDAIGYCGYCCRSDDSNVIFVNVGEINNET